MRSAVLFLGAWLFSLQACGLQSQGLDEGGGAPEEQGGAPSGGQGGAVSGGSAGAPAGGASGQQAGAGKGGAGKGGAGKGGAAGGSQGGSSGSGGCQQPADCDDDNPCTLDSCEAGSCVNDGAPEGQACDDGVKCNGVETCDGKGACLPGAPVDVDDKNPCTTDSCDEVSGAPVHSVIEGCQGCLQPAECPPPGPCFEATCIDKKCGQKPAPKGTSCSDGDGCNGDELCDGSGSCKPGTPKTIDDKNACTTDKCDPATGNVTNEKKDISDGDECTEDLCDPATGAVDHPAISCPAPSCKDGVETSSTCNPAKGCETQTTDCPGSLGCSGASCATKCTPGTGEGCLAGLSCLADGSDCKLPLGAACASDDQCTSGICERAQDNRKCGAVKCPGPCSVLTGDGKGCENADNFSDPKDACSGICTCKWDGSCYC